MEFIMDEFENKNPEILNPDEAMEIVGVEPPTPSINWKKEFFEWGQAVFFAVIVVILVRTFLFTLVLVDGPSMQPTLETGDRLFVNKLMYTPENGDIAVFVPENFPNKPFIKRIIAVPGQTVDIDFETAVVTVDGKIVDEPYIKTPTSRSGNVKFPVTVPEGYFFVMGDNRGNSHDSRDADVGDTDNDQGLINESRLIGKAIFRIWPFSKFGSVY